MGLIERWLWAPLVDAAMRQEPVMAERARIVPRAGGRVLEVGMGSGLNLAYYDRGRVATLWALEPSPSLRARAAARARAAGLPVEFIGLSGERIPLPDASCDDVVVTWTLCSIPDVAAALGEMRRVLRPGGRLLFAEHGLAPDLRVARWQHRLNPFWVRLSGGCNMNRSPVALIRAGGFEPEEVETTRLPGPAVLTHNVRGIAVRR
jgi:ubiquinone/menaquinone biosynthesis C-methylase UbiE